MPFSPVKSEVLGQAGRKPGQKLALLLLHLGHGQLAGALLQGGDHAVGVAGHEAELVVAADHRPRAQVALGHLGQRAVLVGEGQAQVARKRGDEVQDLGQGHHQHKGQFHQHRAQRQLQAAVLHALHPLEVAHQNQKYHKHHGKEHKGGGQGELPGQREHVLAHRKLLAGALEKPGKAALLLQGQVRCGKGPQDDAARHDFAAAGKQRKAKHQGVVRRQHKAQDQEQRELGPGQPEHPAYGRAALHPWPDEQAMGQVAQGKGHSHGLRPLHKGQLVDERADPAAIKHGDHGGEQEMRQSAHDGLQAGRLGILQPFYNTPGGPIAQARRHLGIDSRPKQHTFLFGLDTSSRSSA